MERAAETGKQHEPSTARAGYGRDVSPSATSLPPALQLQQLAGNQAMQELLRSGYIHAKLAISNPDDPEEREADNVANTIMRKAAGAPCSCSPGEEMCEECQQKQSPPTIRRRASAPAAPGHVPRIVSDVLGSPGHPLDVATRAFFEPRFGRNFGHVRVHTGPEAAASARSIHAHAYTLGSDIVFASDQYSPDTPSGRSLLAHELTHVTQTGTRVIRREPAPSCPASALSCPPATPAAQVQPTKLGPPAATGLVETLNGVTISEDKDQVTFALRNKVVEDGIAAADNFLAWLEDFTGPQLEGARRFKKTYEADPSGVSGGVPESDAEIHHREKIRDLLLPVVRVAVAAVDQEVRDAQSAFLADIDAFATNNLFENRAYVMERKKTLGLQEGSKSRLSERQQAEWRKQIQDLAWQVWELKQAQAKLKKTVIGWRPMAWVPPSPIYFNPEYPERDPLEGFKGTRPKWEDLKLTWDLIGAEVARVASKYPEIYEALATKAPEDELLNMSRLIPSAFESNTARLLDELLVRIDQTQSKLGKSIDYFDLKPIIRRLLQGAPASSGRKWNVGFDHWAAQALVDERQKSKEAEDTALAALEVLGLLVATFGTGGLALLIGGTLAVGVPIARGISDWSTANELDQAAKATPMGGTDIVAQAQADSAKAKAIGEIVRGVFNAITIGGTALWQAARGAITAAKLERIGELSAGEAAELVEKAISQIGTAKTAASSGKTIEELIAITGEKSPAIGPLRAYNSQLLAKSFEEITPEEFAASEALQNRVYNMALDVQARQQALGERILAKLAIKGGKVKSILKRPDLKSFSKGILEKTGRPDKDYERLSQMDDIVRGRFDLPTQKDVDAVAKALQNQSQFKVVEVVEPRVAGGVVKYPRYHVILKDTGTGLTHEWQVGTEALTKLYEEPGVAIPEELANAARQLGKEFHPDLHDIEYDLFQSINRQDPAVAAKYGLPDFIQKVARASQRAGEEGAAFKDLPEVARQLHVEAGSILSRLIEGEGADWVAKFFH